MKVKYVLFAAAITAYATQIPLYPSILKSDTPINAENPLNYINKLNSDSGNLLEPNRNVALLVGHQHVSYRDGRLLVQNSTEYHPNTIWQIRYDNNQVGSKASICAEVYRSAPRCWDSGSGPATIGGSRSSRYLPSIVGGNFVFWESSYCLAVSSDRYHLEWTYNSDCTHFTLK